MVQRGDMTPIIHRDPHIDATEFHGMISASPAMFEVFEIVRRLARTDTPALVRGESGTGKELVARALHALSPRSSKPIEAVNCATLRPELAASALFGHVRGAFTGAVAARSGLFNLADGGSVFLDEIAELPADVQAQLLRVLQEGTFTPVGGTRSLSADVRLIAATLRSLRDAVADGEFREDLMYRVRVVPIYLPPLAQRDNDVELLSWVLIARFNEAHQRTVDGITTGFRDAIRAYRWPGNVRELRNAIEHAFILSDGDTLDASHLPGELRGEGPPDRHGNLSNIPDERTRVTLALEAHGSKQAAADALGISRTTLWRKMREMGLD